MFKGFSAFPLTPFSDGAVDLPAFTRLVAAAARAGADSIGALGSTGGAAYLSSELRADITRAAVEAAGDVPVIVGVGAISTTAVLENVADAMDAGAAGVLLSAMSYQPLTDGEVYGLFEDVTTRFPEVPVVLYDNPRTTGFTFSDELRVEVAHLPGVASIKLTSIPDGRDAATAYVQSLRRALPAHVTIGISGDGAAAHGLLAGCDVWYGVLGGIFPDICRQLTTAALSGDEAQARAISGRLAPIWSLFAEHGSFRVAAAIATLSGRVSTDPVFAPVRPLSGSDRDEVHAALKAVGPLAGSFFS